MDPSQRGDDLMNYFKILVTATIGAFFGCAMHCAINPEHGMIMETLDDHTSEPTEVEKLLHETYHH